VTGKQMIDDEQIERNKLAAARGWLADPPPHPLNRCQHTTSASGGGCTARFHRANADVTRRIITAHDQIAKG